MKRNLFTTIGVVCCFVVCFAVVTDLNGKWTGSIKAPDGNEYPVNYTFKIDGDKLTGTGSSPDGDVPITNGKMDGAKFSFNISINGTDVKNTGTYYAAADSTGLDMDFNGFKMHALLKRNTN